MQIIDSLHLQQFCKNIADLSDFQVNISTWLSDLLQVACFHLKL